MSLYVNRWYQTDAENSIFDYFGEKGMTGNPVVVMPTGTGKSVVIANFIKRAFFQYPGQRVMMLTHVKELIDQNREKLLGVWNTAPVGVYSAGLKGRDKALPIIFGGVQSVAPAIAKAIANNEPHFGFRDLLIVDECHLLSDKETSHYQYIITELKKINPYLKVIGFSATPYRMKMGMITENGVFTDICFDISGVRSFNRLINEGFLSPLIARPTHTEIDVSSVGLVGGEFNAKQLEKAADKNSIVEGAVKEMLEMAAMRKCWLLFATGIENTEHVADEIQRYGLDVLPVHSKLSAKVNDERLAAFKAGELRGIVSGQKLTTGFDHPPIDFIGDLNPTMSPGKHVQKLGRGTRPFAGKVNCLYADFGTNVARLGPINDPKIPNKPGQGGGDAPVRICEIRQGGCGCYNHAAARQCEVCGLEFTFKSKVKEMAGSLAPIKTEEPEIAYYNVDRVVYNIHKKVNREGIAIKPPSLKVSYFCGFNKFDEFVCIEHGKGATEKARQWWQQRHTEEMPLTTWQALSKVTELRCPKRIRVWVNKKFPEILNTEW